MKTLDLGGIKSIKESENVVTVNLGGLGDVEHDLNKFPYPFKDESFDEVLLFHVLEHLENPWHLHEFKESWFRNLDPDSNIYSSGGVENMIPFLPKLRFTVVKLKKHRGRFKRWKVYELEVWLRKEVL